MSLITGKGCSTFVPAGCMEFLDAIRGSPSSSAVGAVRKLHFRHGGRIAPAWDDSAQSGERPCRLPRDHDDAPGAEESRPSADQRWRHPLRRPRLARDDVLQRLRHLEVYLRPLSPLVSTPLSTSRSRACWRSSLFSRRSSLSRCCSNTIRACRAALSCSDSH